MHTPFVFFSIQPYPPVALAVFSYLEFDGDVPSPTLWWSCHTLAAVGSLPLYKHTEGGGATPTFSGWLFIFTVYMRECPFPPFQWSFPHDSCCYKLSPLQGCWAGAAPPDYFMWRVPFPYEQELRAPCPLCYVFFSAACLFSVCFFFSFFPSWDQSGQGAVLMCSRVVHGNIICHLAHLVVCFFQAG
jgi:hypothetical protein